MYTVASVISADGTVIGYRQFGTGPGVVLVHGGMQAAQSFTALATALSDTFTVYVPDRRGRGASGPFGDDHGIARDCEDLAAILAGTGARNVFGLSSGALISLFAARSQPAIDKLALYEPPLSIHHSTPTGWLTRLDRDIARGRLGSAAVAVMKGTRTAPTFIQLLPSFVLAPLLNRMLTREDTSARPDDVPLRALVPTVHYDARIVIETDGDVERFADVPAQVLLLGGSRSPAYLKGTLDALETTLPHVTRVELAGADHLAAADDGQPGRVAAELRRFFTATVHR